MHASTIENPFQPAPFRPMLNVGCLFDHLTGRYVIGKHGESILNGGLAYVEGFAGRGNTFKTTIALYRMFTALDRYFNSTGQVYDTEMSATMDRFHELTADLPRIGGIDLQEEGRLVLTDRTMHQGTEWFDKLKEYMKARKEAFKKLSLTTPFIDKNGNYISIPVPYLVGIDSLSMFAADVVLNVQEKGGVGDSERNIEAMRDASSKNQLLMELPAITASSGTYVQMTAHAGDVIDMDPHKPTPKKLTFLKGGVKLKNVPEKFTFLPNNCWLSTGSTPMINQSTKTVEFPRNSDDDVKGDTDLMAVTCMNLRGKSGPSGMPFEVVVSQRQGVLEYLTQFLFIKQNDRFGIGGNDRNYFLDIMPDVNLSRTTVRGKLERDRTLRRALEITSNMLEIFMWHNCEPKYNCTPKQLFDELKAKGYDWDILLNTRSYWVFLEDKHPQPFLSAMDLLKMRVGEYVPYWYPKDKLKDVAAPTALEKAA